MRKGGLLTLTLVSALLISGRTVVAGVTGDDSQTARVAASHAEQSHSGSLLNDLLAAPVVRDLIVRKVVVGLSATYGGNSVDSPLIVIVHVNQGADSRGISYLSVAKAWFPSTYEGFPLNFSDAPVPAWSIVDGADSAAANRKISDDEISRAQKALLDFSAMPGVRRLIASGAIYAIAANYTVPPPELFVAANLNRGQSLEYIESQIPASFEGFPVLLTQAGTYEGTASAFGVFGTDPKRPGRGHQPNPQ